MAILETLLGSAVGAFLQVLLDRMAHRKFWDFLKEREFDIEASRSLESALRAIIVVLSDAEEKQVASPTVKHWLDNLKDAAYDAEDLLDEIATEPLRNKLTASSNSETNQAQETATDFEVRIDSKMKKITDRLSAIIEQKKLLNLKEGTVGKPAPRLPATSLVDESEIFGRSKDNEMIVDFLLSDCSKEHKIPLVAIVGMPGIGKTTLAQLLYNNKRVILSFDLRAWAYVSEELDVLKVTKTIYEAVASHECNTTDLNILQVRLQEHLVGKKFLLILDNVWNENFSDWDVLQRPFKAGATGSRIVVTTRSSIVASIMRAALTHVLPQLSHEDCWSLFARHAFRDGKSPATPDLKEIAEKIVNKCNGVPLAAKTLGALLHTKPEIGQWVKVLESKIWDLSIDKGNILPALRLSYFYLPAHLKRCFAYCSLFPNGHRIKKKNLILLWMAEGLVLQPRSMKNLEDVAEEYFQELLSRSFFQQSRDDKTSFIMHDLFNDLAQSIAGEFYFKLEDHNPYQVSEKLRHFSYSAENQSVDLEKFDALVDASRLRTFLPLKSANSTAAKNLNSSLLGLLPKFHRLRVLSLSPYKVSKLDSINHLKHLRYLDLSDSLITNLPNSAAYLYNLETLLLPGCHHLTMLPESIGGLKHLRYLDLSRSAIQNLPECVGSLCNLETLLLLQCRNLTMLPESIGGLKHLRYLDLSRSGIQNLPECVGSLCNLETLLLPGCHRLTMLPESIGRLKHLHYLDLSRSVIQNLPECVGSLCNLETLLLPECPHLTTLPENMQELTKLCHLDIQGTQLEKMPQQFGNLKSLQLLTDFVVGNGGSRISELKELNHLRGKISITGLQNVIDARDASTANLKAKMHLSELLFLWNIGDHDAQNETHVMQNERDVINNLQPNENLQKLNIEGYAGRSFPIWLGDVSFSNMVSLCISNCNNCDILPPLGQLSSLKKLHVAKMNGIREVGPEFCGNASSISTGPFRSLETLKFKDMLNWATWASFSVDSKNQLPRIQKIHIINCPQLIGNLPNDLPSLKSLRIRDCVELKFQHDNMVEQYMELNQLDIRSSCKSLISLRLHCFTKLQNLYLETCNGLKILDISTSQDLSFLQNMDIRDCPNLEFSSQGVLRSPNLELLLLSNCNNLTKLPKRMDNLTSLQKLKISQCPELVSFPEGGLPANIESLSIVKCVKLTPQLDWALQRMTSLNSFEIVGGCSGLELFPDEGLLPATLTHLHISELQELKNLNYQGLQHLISLQILVISRCEKLECILKGRLPPSCSLSTHECPLLTEQQQ